MYDVQLLRLRQAFSYSQASSSTIVSIGIQGPRGLKFNHRKVKQDFH